MCEETLRREYDDKILDLAERFEQKRAIDSNTLVCIRDYTKAKRYKGLLTYLKNDVCCPSKTRYDIIAKLHLNSKI